MSAAPIQFPALTKRMPWRSDHQGYTFPKGATLLGEPLPYAEDTGDGKVYVYGGKWNKDRLDRYFQQWRQKAEKMMWWILDPNQSVTFAKSAVLCRRPMPPGTLKAWALKDAVPTEIEQAEIDALLEAVKSVRDDFRSSYGDMPNEKLIRKVLADKDQVALLAGKGWLDAWVWNEKEVKC